MEGFGEKLRGEREKQGYTLEHVEEETKIRKIYLRALEEEKFETLPPRVYASGFVKRYAKFLKLDEEEMAKVFQNLAYPVPEEDQKEIFTHEASPFAENKLHLKKLGVAAVFLAIVIWLGSYVVGYISDQNLPQETPPSGQKQDVTEPVSEPSKPTESPEKTGLKLTVHADEDCWLQVFVDDESKYMNTLPAGESLNFQGKNTIKLTAGNAGGISLKLNDETIPPIGEGPQVVEKTFEVDKLERN